MIPYVATTMYASDILACSTATIDGGYTEARYTDYAFSACCTDGISACKPDHSSIHTYISTPAEPPRASARRADRPAERAELVRGLGGGHAVAQPLRDDPLLALVDGAARVLGVPVLHDVALRRPAEVEVDRLAAHGPHVHARVREARRAAAVGDLAVHE